jgi:flagellar hook-length control protein FliK
VPLRADHDPTAAVCPPVCTLPATGEQAIAPPVDGPAARRHAVQAAVPSAAQAAADAVLPSQSAHGLRLGVDGLAPGAGALAAPWPGTPGSESEGVVPDPKAAAKSGTLDPRWLAQQPVKAPPGSVTQATTPPRNAKAASHTDGGAGVQPLPLHRAGGATPPHPPAKNDLAGTATTPPSDTPLRPTQGGPRPVPEAANLPAPAPSPAAPDTPAWTAAPRGRADVDKVPAPATPELSAAPDTAVAAERPTPIGSTPAGVTLAGERLAGPDGAIRSGADHALSTFQRNAAAPEEHAAGRAAPTARSGADAATASIGADTRNDTRNDTRIEARAEANNPAATATAARAALIARQAGASTLAGAVPVGGMQPTPGMAEVAAGLAATLAPAAPTAGATGAAPQVHELRLPQTPGQPGFAAAVGAQVSLMVRDGVQTARLHLNPAQLGPITVQIAVEGNSAQVHLAVEHALTRQALEQAMPTLAGSLRDSGLTLTGGGVFEQPRDAGPQDGAQAGTPGSGQREASAREGLRDAAGARPQGDADGARTTTAPLPRQRGVVDLVA